MCRKYIITGTNKIRPKRKGNFDREVKVTFLFCVIRKLCSYYTKSSARIAPRGEEFNASRESHCGEVESCRKRDPPQAENSVSRILKKRKK